MYVPHVIIRLEDMRTKVLLKWRRKMKEKYIAEIIHLLQNAQNEKTIRRIYLFVRRLILNEKD